MKYSIALILTLLAFSLQAQQGTVRGRVADSRSGENIEYATVALLKPADSSLVGGTVTDGSGSFNIKAPYGRYLLRVTFMGYNAYYHPDPIVLSQQRSAVNVGRIKIAPSATMMEEVTVTAERTMVEYQLDKRVINVDKNLVAGGGTATDILENVPSVTIDGDGNISLRGSTNVKVLIDGRPYELLGSDLETLLEQIPASTVENVEVITNPSAKYDPEGMSGIINIKLKDKQSAALGLGGIANINLGTPLAFLYGDYVDAQTALVPTAMLSANLNYTTERYNLFLSADGGVRSRANRGWSNVERMRDSTVVLSHDSLSRYGYNPSLMGSIKVGGEYYFDSANTLLASYQLRGGNRIRKNIIYSTDLLNDGLLNYTQTDRNYSPNLNHAFNVSYTHRFPQKDRQFMATATFNTRSSHGTGWQEQVYTVPASNLANYYYRESESDNAHRGLNVQINYTHPFAGGWKMETGYESNLDWPDQDAVYRRTEYDTNGTLFTYLDTLSSTHFVYNQQIHAAYVTFGGRLAEGLTAQVGLRGEYTYMNGLDLNHPMADTINKDYFKLYPTLHLSYDINKRNSVQLSYSRRVRRPHMWDLNPYLNVREGQELHFGNPTLDPEFTNAFELSYNISLDKVNIYTSAYFRQTNNMMTRYGYVWDSVSADRYSPWMPYNADYDGYWASTWQNLNRGQNYGLEVIADWQILSWWRLNVSLNFYHSMIEGTDLLDNKEVNSPQLNGKFTSYMNLPSGWTIQFSGQYWAPHYDLQTRMFGSFWTDLAIKKDVLQKRATINLRVGDVLCTGGWGHETYTAQLNRVSMSRRISPSITIGFSYKINQGLRSQRRETPDMDDDGSDSEY